MLALLKLIPAKVWGLIVVSLIVMAVIGDIARLKSKVRNIALQKDSVEAAMSTTVKMNDIMWARRVMQVDLEKDSINKKLKTESKLRADLTAKIDTIHDTVSVAGRRTGDSTTFKFDRYNEPYRLAATVVVRDTMAKLDYTIKQDPMKLGVRLECGPEKDGVRPATILLIVPRFVSANVDSVKQSKEVCSPAAADMHTSTGAYVKAGVVIGGGIFVYQKLIAPLFTRK